MWFRSERFGVTPIAWQGWLALVLYAAAILVSILAVPGFLPDRPIGVGAALFAIVIWTVILLAVSRGRIETRTGVRNNREA